MALYIHSLPQYLCQLNVSCMLHQAAISSVSPSALTCPVLRTALLTCHCKLRVLLLPRPAYAAFHCLPVSHVLACSPLTSCLTPAPWPAPAIRCSVVSPRFETTSQTVSWACHAIRCSVVKPSAQSSIRPYYMALPCHDVLIYEALGAVQHPSLFRDIALP